MQWLLSRSSAALAERRRPADFFLYRVVLCEPARRCKALNTIFPLPNFVSLKATIFLREEIGEGKWAGASRASLYGVGRPGTILFPIFAAAHANTATPA